MTIKTQKYISLGLTSLFAFGGFEALIYILNLNQPAIYLQTAFWLYLYLIFQMAFLFDLHLKNPGSFGRAIKTHKAINLWLPRFFRVYWSAFVGRFRHFRQWRYINLWLHYLLVPSFIFWASISLFFVNFGFLKIQHVIAVLSALSLVLGYMFVKEDLYRKKEKTDSDIFIALTMIKIYASAILYASSISMLRRLCLPPDFFVWQTFAYTFLLVYQALFLHKMVTIKNIGITIIISLMMALAGLYVYLYWGFNYFTAAIFLSAGYNLLWSLFHQYLDGALTWKVFFELIVISFLIGAMLFGVTNFRARILNSCQYSLID